MDLFRRATDFRTAAIVASVLAGVALTSGLAREDAYGSSPVAGVAVGVVAGLCYAAFLLVFRAANRSLAPTSGPLLDSTIGTLTGALLSVPFDPRFAIVPVWPAHLWLVLLALASQVVGWLLIATALPRLPAVETSIILLIQPVFAVLWAGWCSPNTCRCSSGWDRPVLGGVATLSAGGALTTKR
jgi:drug/metabolite transporter (DMT)-like permease